MWLFFIISLGSSYKISMIPESGPPPSPRLRVASVYDSLENRIIFFGGEGSGGSNDLSSTLYEFSLSTLTWGKIPSKMGLVPPGLSDVFMYLRGSDRKIFIFCGMSSKGENNVVYSFDLIQEFWDIEKTKGDRIVPIIRSSITQFIYNDVSYIAIYGGSTRKGKIDNFYLIETEEMIVKEMPKIGDDPGLNNRSSILYYNESLYMYGTITARGGPCMYKFNLENKTWSFIQEYGEKIPNLLYYDMIVKGESFYLLHGVIVGTASPQLSYYRFDLSTSTWIKLSSFLSLNDWIYFYSTVQINGKLYLGFGKTIIDLRNSIIRIEINDDDSIIRTTISENFVSPEPRRNHLSFLSNQHMYIYGGITDEGTFLKDLWKFDFIGRVWHKVVYTGTPPLDRENIAHTPVFDIGFYAFGGNSESEFFNDIFFYEIKNDIWIHFNSYQNAPNPRYGSCIVHNKQKLYVIGGQNDQFSFGDIWSFDSLENYFTLLEDKLPFSLAFHKCWGVDKNDQFYIYIMGGKNFYGVTTRYVHRITINIESGYSVIAEEINYDFDLRLSYTSLIVSGNSAHLFIGSPHEGNINTTMISYDMCTNKLNYTVFPSKYGVYGHSAVHYGRSIYVFGGGYSIVERKIDNSATNNFYNFSLPDILNCSLGLFEENSECKSCPSGTFGEYTSNCSTDEYCTLCSITKTTCNPCSPGRYSIYQGSSSKYSCSLCPKGYFTDKPGSSYCRECSEASICHIGCSKPLKYSDKFEFFSVQPEVYESQKQFANLFINNLWYSVAFIIFILFVCFKIFKKIQKNLLKIDIYTDAHSQEINVPIFYRKTSIGGLFSIIFFVFLIAILISAYITYAYDNVVENRTLVPLVTVKETSEAQNFLVYTKFHVYGGLCIGIGGGNCNPELIINDYGLAYDKRNVECSINNEGCLVKITYNNIKVSGNFRIYYKMKEVLSFTDLITVNISVTTGIPEGFSKNYIPIYPTPENFIFRGINPTVLKFELIPTFFKSESTEWVSSDKGFHLRYDHSPQYGSMIDPKQLYTTSYIYLRLEFEISNTALKISRELKTSLYLVFSGMIGMVAGVLESVGTAMGYFEGFVESIRKKKHKRKRFKNISNKREFFIDFLSDNAKIKKSGRRSSLPKPRCDTSISKAYLYKK